MKEENIVARRHIIDHVRNILMPYSIEIKKDLYSSVQGVSAGYREHLERKISETVISQKWKKSDSFQWHVKAKRAVWAIKRSIDLM